MKCSVYKIIYIVKFGDILWDIVCKYKVFIKKFVSWNGMVLNDMLKFGKILVVW